MCKIGKEGVFEGKQRIDLVLLERKDLGLNRKKVKSGGPKKIWRKKVAKEKRRKRTTPGIPTWSPTVVLTWPDDA